MQPILQVENLSKYYVNGQNVVAGLSRVNLRFHRGEFVAITGESGSGKSTLAHVLGGVLPYEDGQLYIDGEPTAHYDGADWENYRRDQVAFISQSYGILPGATVYDNVASALLLGGMGKEQVRQQTEDILREVELWPMQRRRAARLSSGQKQRLAIARALAKPCPILIADEPTGNLDPENSEKVIRLLAQAAKERLVILITHEFSEAEGFVTRHIRIHDGVVAGDEMLHPVPQRQWQPRQTPKRKKLGGYTAWLQLRSRPVWTALVLLFFVATAFSVFAFLGSFIVATDDTPTRIYQSDAFLNGSPDRIVVVRKDFGEMTQADYDKILGTKYVQCLERYGYIADMVYAYQKNVDYTFNYKVENIGTVFEPVYKTFESVQITTGNQFLRTVPLGIDDFLTEGRLPEKSIEVVATDPQLLGKTITVYVQNAKTWGKYDYVQLEAQVVGITRQGSGLYFSNELAAALSVQFTGEKALVLPWYEDIALPVTYVDYITASEYSLALVNGRDPIPFYTESVVTDSSAFRPMQDNEVLISHSVYCQILNTYAPMEQQRFAKFYDFGGTYVNKYYPGFVDTKAEESWTWLQVDGSFNPYYDVDIYDGFDWNEFSENGRVRVLDIRIAGLHTSTLQSLLYVSPDRYQQYMETVGGGGSNQVSITVKDYSYVERVIDALDDAGYYAVSPFVLGSTMVDETLAAQRMQTLYVCLGALLAVILLQMIVLRALFGMQNESYRLLSQIGLTWGGARTSVWLQVLLFMVAGQAIGFGLIGLGSYLGVERLVNLTKYLHSTYWGVLSLVHLAVSLVAGLAILRSLKKKIYPLSARPRDLAPRGKEAAK